MTVKELGMRIRILIYGVRDRGVISSGKAWYKSEGSNKLHFHQFSFTQFSRGDMNHLHIQT